MAVIGLVVIKGGASEMLLVGSWGGRGKGETGGKVEKAWQRLAGSIADQLPSGRIVRPQSEDLRQVSLCLKIDIGRLESRAFNALDQLPDLSILPLPSRNIKSEQRIGSWCFSFRSWDRKDGGGG
jgi:hypothetical protein